MWSNYGFLLGAGYQTKWHPLRGFEGFVPDEKGDWQLKSLNDLVLNEAEGVDVVQSAYDRLEAVLKKILCAKI